ncbi:MAG: hypothetical protein JW798_15480, partial [Prolixibacteraceae bacterium]|nr:hypothetical protein [Prolixibacteraceae bacterium]
MRILPVIILLLIAASLYAQPTRSGMQNDSGQPEMAESDSVMSNAETVKSEIKVWTLKNQYSTINEIELDTANLNFHNYNPIFKKSISNNYLGYLGAPYQSNIFFDREETPEYYFLKNINHYYTSPEEVKYYNTTTPFAVLRYEEGSRSDQDQQMFTAFFSRNIDPGTNFGFRYDAHKSKGQYVFHESLHEHLNIFFSRNSERYNAYVSVLTGTNMVVENGGISKDEVNPFYPPKYYSPNLDNAIEMTVKNISVFTSHEYLLGSLSSLFKKHVAEEEESYVSGESDTLSFQADSIPLVDDSLAFSTDSTASVADSTGIVKNKKEDKGFVPAYSIQYSASYNSFNRYLLENTVDHSFFDTTYIGFDSYNDSSLYNTFTQILQLKAFENPNRKFTFGKRVFLENEIVEAVHALPYGQTKYNYSNIFVGGEIYRREGDFWNWNALARIAVLGRNIGDAMLKGSINKPLRIFNDTTHIIAEGWYRDTKAPIFLENWQSNHFKWENRFRKQHEVIIKGKISYPRFKLQTGVNYALLA